MVYDIHIRAHMYRHNTSRTSTSELQGI